MVAKATKFLCLQDVSWPNWCLYQVSTWLVNKEQNYCSVFVFSLFRVFVFQLFKMLGNTGMVAKATKILYLEDVSWPTRNWCLYKVSTWLASKQHNYCRVFVFSLFRVFVFQLFKMLGNTGMVARATKILYLEHVSWPTCNWCLYQVSTWLVRKEQNYYKVFVFSLFRVFVFQLFKMLGNTGMVAKVTKFLCLEDVSWPNWCLYQISTWLVSKEQNYCRVFVFQLFKMLWNTGMVAKATKFLCLEDVSWPNWCLYQVSTWLVSKEQNYCRVFVFSLFMVFVFQLFKMLENTGMEPSFYV